MIIPSHPSHSSWMPTPWPKKLLPTIELTAKNLFDEGQVYNRTKWPLSWKNKKENSKKTPNKRLS